MFTWKYLLKQQNKLKRIWTR